ncbi:MAG: hypothetical protein ABSE76_03645 [Minisyncoccia bacterium]|jgi:hypothetical protein
MNGRGIKPIYFKRPWSSDLHNRRDPISTLDYLIEQLLYGELGTDELTSDNPFGTKAMDLEFVTWGTVFAYMRLPSAVIRIPLNKDEKRFILSEFRRVRGLGAGRMREEHREEFKRIETLLSQTHGNASKSRTLEEIVAVVNLRNADEPKAPASSGNPIPFKRRTFGDVADEILDSPLASEETKQINIRASARYRKRDSRVRRRLTALK